MPFGGHHVMLGSRLGCLGAQFRKHPRGMMRRFPQGAQSPFELNLPEARSARSWQGHAGLGRSRELCHALCGEKE